MDCWLIVTIKQTYYTSEVTNLSQNIVSNDSY